MNVPRTYVLYMIGYNRETDVLVCSWDKSLTKVGEGIVISFVFNFRRQLVQLAYIKEKYLLFINHPSDWIDSK